MFDLSMLAYSGCVLFDSHVITRWRDFNDSIWQTHLFKVSLITNNNWNFCPTL